MKVERGHSREERRSAVSELRERVGAEASVGKDTNCDARKARIGLDLRENSVRTRRCPFADGEQVVCRYAQAGDRFRARERDRVLFRA